MTRSTAVSVTAMMAAATLSACGSPQPNTSAQPTPPATPPPPVSTPAAPAPKPVAAADPDTLAEPVSDCRPESVLPLTTDITSSGSANAVAVCRQMTLVFGSPPQVRVLRSMTATLTAYADGDPRDEPRSLAGLLVFAHLRGADTPEVLLSHPTRRAQHEGRQPRAPHPSRAAGLHEERRPPRPVDVRRGPRRHGSDDRGHGCQLTPSHDVEERVRALEPHEPAPAAGGLEESASAPLPSSARPELLRLALAWRIQAQAFGGLDAEPCACGCVGEPERAMPPTGFRRARGCGASGAARCTRWWSGPDGGYLHQEPPLVELVGDRPPDHRRALERAQVLRAAGRA